MRRRRRHPSWLACACLAFGASSALAGPPAEPLLQAEPSSRSEPTLCFVDHDGRVLGRAEGLPIARTPPIPEAEDLESVRIVAVATSAATLPKTVTLTSFAAPDGGQRVSTLDVAGAVDLVSADCPAGIEAGRSCAWSSSIRPVPDELDRRHPLLAQRSLLAELGGSLVATAGSRTRASVRVIGPEGRHRARLRVHLVRLVPGGPPPIGRDDSEAARLVREEVGRASAVWGACGISFGPPDQVAVAIVDPPPTSLVSLGCDGGLLAEGNGELRVRVDAHDIVVPLARGTSARGAARALASSLEALGYAPIVSDNAAVHAVTFGTSDVLVRRRSGKLAVVGPPRIGPISTDGALDACLGSVALEDGLQHFADADAISGTLEERALVKAFDDGDPSTVEVFVVPSFGGDSRIGESFIFADAGAIKNVVIEDRAGFRAHRASFTLAHEVGHVLLDQPGHPDDFGVDSPTSLMDADAMSPTAFGPRRLGAGECARAHRQSGAGTPSALLAPWPLAP